MRKTKMITREFKVTTGTVLVVDLTTQETQTKTFFLTGSYENAEAILKSVKAQITDETIVPVTILDYATDTKLYGLSEDTFLGLAVELDKETRKPL